MYSDKWIQDKSLHKTAAVKINNTTNILYWLNEKDQLVGVCVNFELVDDVHYELKAENWIRFIKEVLGLDIKENIIIPFREFLNSPIPQTDFGIALYNHNDCDEICCGVNQGWLPNDGLTPLLPLSTIKSKADICCQCQAGAEIVEGLKQETNESENADKNIVSQLVDGIMGKESEQPTEKEKELRSRLSGRALEYLMFMDDEE